MTPLALLAVLLATLGSSVGSPTSTSTLVMIGDPPVVRTPEERFATLPQLGYPWTPKYLHMKHQGNQFVRVHYIDEGPRDAPETLLLLHGTPAWSYLYRKTIPTLLAAGYRVVAIDHIGFGRSDKLTDPEAYTHELHVATVVNAVQDLDLKGVTLVGHDLGGPTGLSALSRDSGRYRRVVLLNTWLPQGDMFSSLSSIKAHLPYLSFRGLTQVLGRNLPLETVFSVATQSSAAEVQGYVAPFPSSLYKAGPSRWPLLIPTSYSDPMASRTGRVAAFLAGWGGAALVAYSDREVFTLPGQDLFRRLLPRACTATVNDAGHFLQEDQGPAVARLIVQFIHGQC
ncbi:LOW QUALITY PROTEIN: haloalkane dehalogenase-like [Penaeus monodon]|uniref:LOW QUALITY PROTEIN: haloalkane dehalogenase-like n=1 Tax=Penaeus monodon TaxID=6687 RepID=UPI0018A77AE3|nr:LOW QUALITY PROTEIN: haloalkane dehalogenase-like [Penaeus monodon]